MFLGQFTHTIGKNNRTSLPVAFRDILNAAGEQNLVVTSYKKYLAAFTPAYFKSDHLDKLKAIPKNSPEYEGFVRSVISRAQTCSIDKLGRILIPPSLREHAELKDEVVFVGMIDYIEIWPVEKWNDEDSRNFDGLDENKRRLSERGY